MAISKTSDERAKPTDLAQSFLGECCAIGDWWLAHAVDHEFGGFWGEVGRDNIPKKSAAKSVVLNARVLWFFSEAAVLSGRDTYADAAHRAFKYFIERFIDPVHGGAFWLVSATGELLDGRKHSYAQSFAIYALSAYYQLSRDPAALALALNIFDLLERHARDRQHGGYFEAFAQDWGPLAEIRLSPKEDNSPKTMNTNLHVLEAYTALFTAVREDTVRAAEVGPALAGLLQVFCERIVDMETGHLRMFMNEAWIDHSHGFSFGHDIEASWLIHKAMTALEVASYPVQRFIQQVERLAEVALRDGLSPTGRMADEYDLATDTYAMSSWWVQAEAMVGFANMWHLGYGDHYRAAALRIWGYVQENYLDREYGEWLWFAKTDVPPAATEYKIGAWKAPYHNGRAMMMMSKLLGQ